MWYSGNKSNWADRIGYAWSLDGITWEKYAGNPVLDVGEAGDWDDQWAGRCRVLKDAATSMYKMWYAGSDVDLPASMGYVTALPTGIYDKVSGELPMNFVLMQNYPNPFNPSTTISYTVSRSDFVSLIVSDVLGREVQILVNENQRPGDHSINFNASKLSSGIYFYTLQAGPDFMQTRKMLLMR
jgi:hypothetical protein